MSYPQIYVEQPPNQPQQAAPSEPLNPSSNPPSNSVPQPQYVFIRIPGLNVRYELTQAQNDNSTTWNFLGGVLIIMVMIVMMVLSIVALSKEEFSTDRMHALMIFYVVTTGLSLISKCCSDSDIPSTFDYMVSYVYCVLTLICFADDREHYTNIVYWYMFGISLFVMAFIFKNANRRHYR